VRLVSVLAPSLLDESRSVAAFFRSSLAEAAQFATDAQIVASASPLLHCGCEW
jgi:hypothetical protein